MDFVSKAVGAVLIAGAAGVASAGVVVYEKDGRSIEIGGRIQVEYISLDPNCPTGVGCFIDEGLDTSDSNLDTLQLRRLRPYIAGKLSERWFGKIEIDFGETVDDDEVQIKDAYLEYSLAGSKTKIAVGNTKPPFSREFLTSSAKLQMVERSFVGDHNFGSLDRMLGVRVLNQMWDDKIGLGASAGVASHDPDVNRVDFDSPVNNKEDWNEGRTAAVRVDFHPLGYVPYSQGDFDRGPFKFTVSAAAFLWDNDGDNNTYPVPTTRADLDESTGLELSGALRGHGFSMDASVQRTSADTVDGTFTGGLYLNGSTDLEMFAVVAGYMVLDDRLEVTARWDELDADNYQEAFRRTAAGVNWFFRQHDLKLQANYVVTRGFLGFADQDQNVLLAMMQYVF